MSSRTRRRSRRPHRQDRRPFAPPVPISRNLPDGVELVEFTVTYEKIDDGTVDLIPDEDLARMQAAASAVIDGATDQAPILEELIEKYPDCRRLYNYLTVAYGTCGDMQKCDDMIRKAYARFPDYLFAMCNYVLQLLDEGRVDEATAILDRRYALHLWITDRRTYHITEVAIFQYMVVRYFLAREMLDAARQQLSILVKVAPDARETRIAQMCFEHSVLRAMLKRHKQERIGLIARQAELVEQLNRHVRLGGGDS